MKTINDIRSIGWLNNNNNTVRLSPVFHGDSMPFFVEIPREEFQLVRGDKDAMKQKALDVLFA